MGAGRGIPGEGTARAEVQRPGATWPVQRAAGGFTGLESGEQWGAGRAPARQAVGLEQRLGELASRQALCAVLGSDVLSWPWIGWHSYAPCLRSVLSLSLIHTKGHVHQTHIKWVRQKYIHVGHAHPPDARTIHVLG